MLACQELLYDATAAEAIPEDLATVGRALERVAARLDHLRETIEPRGWREGMAATYPEIFGAWVDG